jgi:hypothetical protein
MRKLPQTAAEEPLPSRTLVLEWRRLGGGIARHDRDRLVEREGTGKADAAAGLSPGRASASTRRSLFDRRSVSTSGCGTSGDVFPQVVYQRVAAGMSSANRFRVLRPRSIGASFPPVDPRHGELPPRSGSNTWGEEVWADREMRGRAAWCSLDPALGPRFPTADRNPRLCTPSLAAPSPEVVDREPACSTTR